MGEGQGSEQENVMDALDRRIQEEQERRREEFRLAERLAHVEGLRGQLRTSLDELHSGKLDRGSREELREKVAAIEEAIDYWLERPLDK